MSLKKKFVLFNGDIRDRAIEFLMALPLRDYKDGIKVMITENVPNKTRDQEEKYHAQIGDIHKSGKFVFMGRNDWDFESIKRLLIDAFAAVKAEEGQPLHNCQKILPSLDGKRVVHINPKSSEFTRKEGAEFIEFLYAYGTELGVTWKEAPRDDR